MKIGEQLDAGLSARKTGTGKNARILRSKLARIFRHCTRPVIGETFNLTARSIVSFPYDYTLLLKIILLFIIGTGLSLAAPSTAYAACTSFNVPDANTTPSTNPMASGGSISINIGTLCDPFDLNPYPGPNTTAPHHGSVTVDANAGVVTYVNNGDGATSDSFIVADASANPFTINVAIAATTSPITVSPASLPSPQVGTSFSQTLSASGGTAPYTFALTSGSLPPGLSFNGSTIAGTPTQAGNYTVTFTVTATGGVTTTKSYSASVPNPSNNISVAAPPAGSLNTAYSATLSASGALAPYSFALYTGSTMPPGLSLAANGTISGTPTSLGNFSFQVAVTDGSPNLHGTSPGPYFNVVTVNLHVVNVLPPVAGPVSTTVSYGSSSNAITLNLSGGLAASVAIGTQASHGTASASGTSITYTPTAGYAGSDTFTYTATNAGGTSSPATVSVTVSPPTIVMSPASLPSATAGTAYSQTVTTAGGATPYSYAVTAGALPAGVTLSTGGALSGTPTAVGTFNFTVTVTDSSTGTGAPFTGSRAYSLNVAAPTISITPTTLPAAAVAVAYSRSIAASAGTAPYTYAVTAGGLPTGLTLSTAGLLAGTPTAGGTFNFTVTATDSSTGTGAPFTGSRAYTLTVAGPTISIAPTTLPAAAVAAAYSQPVTASGGTGSYTYAVTTGALPAGLSLSATTGTLSGTPTAGGPFNFTITATDSSTGSGPFTGSRAYSLNVAAPTIALNPALLPAGAVGTAYSQILTASGGTGPYSFASTGTLPDGLTLSPSGTLAGTPTAANTFNFTVTATDSSSGSGPFTASRAYSVIIGAQLPIANNVTATVAQNSSANAITLNITGGPAASVAIASAAGHGTATASSTTITYTPTPGYSGPDSFTYTATNSGGTSSPATVSVTVSAPTIVVNPTSLPSATAGTTYSQPVIASGGTAPYTYAVTVGVLPAGLTLSTAGSLSGIPTAVGAFNFTIAATDSSTGTGAPFTDSRAYSLAVAAPIISIGPTTLPAATVASAYSQSVTASGGTTPYTYTVTAGALPVGMSLSTAGVLFGTPTAAGTFNITITAADSSTGTGAPFSASRAYSLIVGAPALSLGPTSLPGGGTAAAYSQPVTASGGVAPYSYAVTVGALPTGLSLSATTGTLSGTPTAGGIFNLTITATDSSTGTGAPFAVSRAYSLTIAAPTISIAPTTLSAATLNASYSQAITASGGISPYSYAIASGTLPHGLSLEASTGVISGTPTMAGTSNFTVAATDSSTGSGPFTGSRTYSLVLTAHPPIANGVTATVAQNSSANPISLNITGGTATSVAIASGAGHGTATASGTSISYTPTSGYSGSDSFTYTATNLDGTSAAATVSVTVSAPTVSLGPPSLPGGSIGAVYSQPVTASGGTNPYSYAVTSGALPAGLTLSSSSGAISGTPTAAGSFNVTITATDSSTGTGAPFTASRAYNLTIAAPTISLDPSTLPAGAAGTAYSQTFSASGGTTPYSYAITSGGLPAGLTLSSTGTLSGTPTAAGTFSITIRATDSSTGIGAPFTAARAYNLTIAAPTITIAPAALPAGTAGTAYSQTITASGGAGSYSYGLSTGSLPTGLSLSSAGVLSGTPTAGGTFNFTVVATDSLSFTSSKAYSLIIGAPSITITPTTLPAATVAASYSETMVASGGTAPHSYAVTAGALPNGLTLSPTGTLSGTPTAANTFNFTVTATDSSTGAGPFTGSHAYTLVVSVQPPIANGVTTTVAANSSANGVTLAITGGTPTSVAVATGAGHGTATASGTSITYTPASGYSGSDSFTYTATNASGTSAPATVGVTITAPTLVFSPAGGALGAGVVGTAYSQTVTASGGTSPYSYSETGTLPAGLTLNHTTGAITGTPTTSGNYSFTVTATDANSANSSAAYTIAISPPPTTFVFTPPGGALTDAMAGEAYSQQISATGGTGTKIYSLTSGSLPNGLVLNISTGQLTGPLAPGTEGDYSFSIQIRDGNGATATASYTLKVKGRSVTVEDMVVNVPEGSTPPDVYLNRGATGGPFTSAILASLTPANAGTATIIQGQLAAAGPVTTPVGWYMHFTPNPAYSGQVRVGYELVSALGTSNTATITYNIHYDAGKVAEDIDNLVHDFVQTRQNMIANTIEVPGLLQRRQMQKATDPITARMMPSEEGMTLGFSTSLSQMRAASGDPDAASAPFNVWIGGAFLAHDDKGSKDTNSTNGTSTNGTSKWGSFAMINMGVDYLLSDRALIGISFHYDRMTDPTDQDTELTGNGWLAGPYASLELGKGVFWNGSLRYGGSSNTINTEFWNGNFTTTRWMADTSIEGEWNLDEETTLSPKLRAIYFSEKVDDYSVKNSAGDTIAIDGFNEDQFRVSLGAEIARSFELEGGTKLTPKLGLTGGFSGLDGAGAFGAVTAGLTMQTMNFWMLDTSILFNIEGDGQKSVGAKVAASKKF